MHRQSSFTALIQELSRIAIVHRPDMTQLCNDTGPEPYLSQIRRVAFCAGQWCCRGMLKQVKGIAKRSHDVGQLVCVLGSLQCACQHRLQQLGVKVKPAAGACLQDRCRQMSDKLDMGEGGGGNVIHCHLF